MKFINSLHIASLIGLFSIALLAQNTCFAREKDTTIRFKSGQSSAILNDQVKGYNKTYVFNAKAGQNLALSLVPRGGDKGQLAFTLYAYCGEEYGQLIADMKVQWQGQLTCNGKHSIDVNPSEDAMKNNYQLNYQLKIAIE